MHDNYSILRQFLTVKQVAKRLGVGELRVLQLLNKYRGVRQLRGKKKGDMWLIHRDDYLAYRRRAKRSRFTKLHKRSA